MEDVVFLCVFLKRIFGEMYYYKRVVDELRWIVVM